MNKDRLSGYAPELYEALKNLLDEIPLIAGDSRHDALAEAIGEADKLIREIEEENELKPCPFCGNPDVYFVHEDMYLGHEIYCGECDMTFDVDAHDATKQDVIAAWNRRAEYGQS